MRLVAALARVQALHRLVDVLRDIRELRDPLLADPMPLQVRFEEATLRWVELEP